jgi:hypothetical protein
MADLTAANAERKPQYLTECPFCRAPILPVWWQLTLVAIGTLILAVGIPAYFGLASGITLVFPALLFCVPALLLAQILVFTIMPPKYARRNQVVTSLFHR